VVRVASYPTAAPGQFWNAGDQLRKGANGRHFAEGQQLVDDHKPSVEKFGLHAVAVVVQKARVLYLDVSQVALDDQPVTWIAITGTVAIYGTAETKQSTRPNIC